MIRRVFELNDLAVGPEHPQAVKIRGLFQAYGGEYDFCRFYRAEEAEAYGLFCVFEQELIGYLWNGRASDEWVRFLQMQPGISGISLIADVLPQSLGEEYRLSSGNLYQKPAGGIPGEAPAFSLPQAQRAYALLEEGFPDQVLPQGFEGWYCDLSHRVRHGVSRVYLEDQAVGILLAQEDSFGVLGPVAVSASARRRGLGSCLLGKIQRRTSSRRIAVYSENSGSDRFYETNGYSKMGRWLYLAPKDDKDR